MSKGIIAIIILVVIAIILAIVGLGLTMVQLIYGVFGVIALIGLGYGFYRGISWWLHRRAHRHHTHPPHGAAPHGAAHAPHGAAHGGGHGADHGGGGHGGHHDTSIEDAVKVGGMILLVFGWLVFKDIDHQFTMWASTNARWVMAAILAATVVFGLTKLEGNHHWVAKIIHALLVAALLVGVTTFVVAHDQGWEQTWSIFGRVSYGVGAAVAPLAEVIGAILSNSFVHLLALLALVWAIVGRIFKH